MARFIVLHNWSDKKWCVVDQRALKTVSRHDTNDQARTEMKRLEAEDR